MASILLVSATQSLCARMPEVISGRGLSVSVLGSTRGLLQGSSFIDSYSALASAPHDFSQALDSDPDLVNRGDDWVLYDSDQLIRALARGSWPDALKRELLPASTDVGLSALGSKVGQQALAEAAGAATPATRVVGTREDISRAMQERAGPLLLKADVGGGGAQVWPLHGPHDLAKIPRLDEHLPALVQEWIEGGLISVEALFRRGQLLGLQYSRIERAMGRGLGPSTVRRFLDPPREVVDTLHALGDAGGLHGFGNLTFVRCHRQQRHLLIECDMRINTCVQYGPQIGVDWGALLAGEQRSRVATSSLGPRGRVIHVYPRSLSAAISEMSLGHLRPWVLREPGTWDTRNHRDVTVNAAERREWIGAQAIARHALHDPLRAAWLRLPAQIRAMDAGMRLKRHTLRGMGIHV